MYNHWIYYLSLSGLRFEKSVLQTLSTPSKSSVSYLSPHPATVAQPYKRKLLSSSMKVSFLIINLMSLPLFLEISEQRGLSTTFLLDKHSGLIFLLNWRGSFNFMRATSGLKSKTF